MATTTRQRIIDVMGEDLPVFAEDSAPQGFTICEVCGVVWPLAKYHAHIGSRACAAEALRSGARDVPRTWIDVRAGISAEVPGDDQPDGPITLRALRQLEIPVLEGVGLLQLMERRPGVWVPPWVYSIIGANADVHVRRVCLRRCRLDLEARRVVIAGLRLFGGIGDDRDAVNDLLQLEG